MSDWLVGLLAVAFAIPVIGIGLIVAWTLFVALVSAMFGYY